jgi:AraC-like DNA-binding protein
MNTALALVFTERNVGAYLEPFPDPGLTPILLDGVDLVPLDFWVLPDKIIQNTEATEKALAREIGSYRGYLHRVNANTETIEFESKTLPFAYVLSNYLERLRTHAARLLQNNGRVLYTTPAALGVVPVLPTEYTGEAWVPATSPFQKLLADKKLPGLWVAHPATHIVAGACLRQKLQPHALYLLVECLGQASYLHLIQVNEHPPEAYPVLQIVGSRSLTYLKAHQEEDLVVELVVRKAIRESHSPMIGNEPLCLEEIELFRSLNCGKEWLSAFGNDGILRLRDIELSDKRLARTLTLDRAELQRQLTENDNRLCSEIDELLNKAGVRDSQIKKVLLAFPNLQHHQIGNTLGALFGNNLILDLSRQALQLIALSVLRHPKTATLNKQLLNTAQAAEPQPTIPRQPVKGSVPPPASPTKANSPLTTTPPPPMPPLTEVPSSVDFQPVKSVNTAELPIGARISLQWNAPNKPTRQLIVQKIQAELWQIETVMHSENLATYPRKIVFGSSFLAVKSVAIFQDAARVQRGYQTGSLTSILVKS